MGADGGYAYLDRKAMTEEFGPEAVALFVRFVSRMFYWPQRENVDVRGWERERFKGHSEFATIRLPTGSNLRDEETLLPLEKLSLGDYINPEDVVFFKAHLWDLQRQMEAAGYDEYEPFQWRTWWRNPLSWFVWDGEQRKYEVPNQKEFQTLQRLTKNLTQYEYLETWT